MATKSKSSKKKPVRRTGKRKKTPAFLFTIIVLLLVAVVFSYFYIIRTTEKELENIFTPISNIFSLKSDSAVYTEETTAKPEIETEKPASPPEKTLLEGTWVSTLNGAMLSFEANHFKLEFPSVEERAMLEGHFKILNNKIHLVNTLSDDLCGMENGTYSFTIKGEDLILEAESDPCNMRKENLSTDWFKL